jgi:glucose-1-phosphate adenylyltransferase
VPPEEAVRFGIVRVDGRRRATAFDEKPVIAATAQCLASLGIYLFSTPVLIEALLADAADPGSSHDFGRDILPWLIQTVKVCAYPFEDDRSRSAYWRDVGTLDAYYQANMDLISADPEYDLHDGRWPLRTMTASLPPARFVSGGSPERAGAAADSLISPGCILHGSRVKRSVLSPRVHIGSYSQIEECVVLENVSIGRNCFLCRAIVEDGIEVPSGYEAGISMEADHCAGHWITPSGVVVLHAGSAGVKHRNMRGRITWHAAGIPAMA